MGRWSSKTRQICSMQGIKKGVSTGRQLDWQSLSWNFSWYLRQVSPQAEGGTVTPLSWSFSWDLGQVSPQADIRTDTCFSWNFSWHLRQISPQASNGTALYPAEVSAEVWLSLITGREWSIGKSSYCKDTIFHLV